MTLPTGLTRTGLNKACLNHAPNVAKGWPCTPKPSRTIGLSTTLTAKCKFVRPLSGVIPAAMNGGGKAPMSNFDPRFYYVREAGEWVPKTDAKTDGGQDE